MVGDGNLMTYPNPASDFINIEYAGTETVNMRMFNTTGQLVLSRDIKSGSSVVDVRNLSSGLYLLRISNKNKRYSIKLFKK